MKKEIERERECRGGGKGGGEVTVVSTVTATVWYCKMFNERKPAV